MGCFPRRGNFCKYRRIQRITCKIISKYKQHILYCKLKRFRLLRTLRIHQWPIFFPDPALADSTSQAAVYRQAFRLVVDFGALPNNGTFSVPHGLTITNTWSFTRIYATASDQTGFNFLPIPSANVNLTVNATNVNITTVGNYSNYNECIVVLEYLKD